MAKTEHYYTKFQSGRFYHVYNRTVDLKAMFKNEDNYYFFLKKYIEYLSPIVETYAYCLLGNHFHLFIRVMDDENLTTFGKLSNLAHPNRQKMLQSTDEIVSHQFRKFFQSYSMAFNKQHERVGTLFQTPFKRVEIDNDSYLMHMVYYVHANPQKHGLIDDFRDWKWSSYHSFLSHSPTLLKREKVLEWFGGKDNFVKYHAIYHQRLSGMERYDIDENGGY